MDDDLRPEFPKDLADFVGLGHIGIRAGQREDRVPGGEHSNQTAAKESRRTGDRYLHGRSWQTVGRRQ